MPINWLFVTNPENWKIVQATKTWGIKKNTPFRILDKIQLGDKCVIYISQLSAIGGIFEIVDKNSKIKTSWIGGQFHTIGLKPYYVPEKPLDIHILISKLKFIKNKSKWQLTFINSGKRIIEDSDMEIIKTS